MNRRLTGVVLAAAILGCGGQHKGQTKTGNEPVEPGATMDVSAALSAALNCPVADITWAVIEVNCGSISAAGIFTAPACGAACLPATVQVRGTGCGKVATLPINVAEAVQSITVCGVASDTSCCAQNLALSPGATAQFYATVTYSCPGHIEYSPSAPPAACP